MAHCARAALRGQDLTAPELLDLEVASVLRRQVFAGLLSGHRAEQALGICSPCLSCG